MSNVKIADRLSFDLSYSSFPISISVRSFNVIPRELGYKLLIPNDVLRVLCKIPMNVPYACLEVKIGEKICFGFIQKV